jgi:hypothetical protein
MVGNIVPILLLSMVMMWLSWVTLTDFALVAVLSQGLIAILLIGNKILQH